MTLQSNEASWADFFVRVEVLETPSLGGLYLLEVGIQNILLCSSSIYRSQNSSPSYHHLDFCFTCLSCHSQEGKTPFFPGQKSSFLFNNTFYTKCLELRLNSPACKHYFLLFENQNCICLPPDFCPSLIIHNSV